MIAAICLLGVAGWLGVRRMKAAHLYTERQSTLFHEAVQTVLASRPKPITQKSAAKTEDPVLVVAQQDHPWHEDLNG